MFCPNCGTRLEENAGFCTVCGAAVRASDMPEGGAFPDPTVLPTPEQDRIDPEKFKPAPQPEQDIDLDSVVENINKPELNRYSFDPDYERQAAWFDDHKPAQEPAPAPENTSVFAQTLVSSSMPRRSNFALGFIGAVVFALIGCVIWVLIGMLGLVSYFGGLALSFLTVTGYRLLGKRFDLVGLFTCLVVVAAAVFAGNLFVEARELSEGLDEMKAELMEYADGEEVTERDIEEVLESMGINSDGFADVFLHFFDYAQNLDEYLSDVTTDTIMGVFRRDLALGYLFAGIAFLVVAIPMFKASRKYI